MAYTVRSVSPCAAGTKTLVVQPAPRTPKRSVGRLNSAEPFEGSVFHPPPSTTLPGGQSAEAWPSPGEKRVEEMSTGGLRTNCHPETPAGPCGPAGPGAPGAPGAPCGPAGPGGPCAPVAPGAPGGPAGPGGPCAPVAPCPLFATTALLSQFGQCERFERRTLRALWVGGPRPVSRDRNSRGLGIRLLGVQEIGRGTGIAFQHTAALIKNQQRTHAKRF